MEALQVLFFYSTLTSISLWSPKAQELLKVLHFGVSPNPAAFSEICDLLIKEMRSYFLLCQELPHRRPFPVSKSCDLKEKKTVRLTIIQENSALLLKELV